MTQKKRSKKPNYTSGKYAEFSRMESAGHHKNYSKIKTSPYPKNSASPLPQRFNPQDFQIGGNFNVQLEHRYRPLPDQKANLVTFFNELIDSHRPESPQIALKKVHLNDLTLQNYLEDKIITQLQMKYQSITIFAHSDWRTVIDMGIPSVYETGIYIHPFDSYPRISASEIKGLLSSCFEVVDGELKPYESKIKEILFGKGEEEKENENSKSNVVIFDGIPSVEDLAETTPIYELDVMTPHHSDYYNNKEKNKPGDWENPTPVMFLTYAPLIWKFKFLIDNIVTKNIQALFPSNSVIINEKIIMKILTECIKISMENALETNGIGARKNAGYGYMKVIYKENKNKKEILKEDN